MSEEKRNIGDLTKEERITSEIQRLVSFYEGTDGNQKAIIIPLIENASFMRVTLEDLQEIINREGTVDRYQNGSNQSGLKISAALQSYNSLMKNYAAVMKTLYQHLPLKKLIIHTYQEPQQDRMTEEEYEEYYQEFMKKVEEIEKGDPQA